MAGNPYPLLTEKQRQFVEVYTGNAAEACRKIGVSPNNSQKFMKNPKVKQALLIKKAVTDNERKSICLEEARKQAQETISEEFEKIKTQYIVANKKELQEFWTSMFTNQEMSPRERLKASELLGKSHGMFLDVQKFEGDIQPAMVFKIPEGSEPKGLLIGNYEEPKKETNATSGTIEIDNIERLPMEVH